MREINQKKREEAKYKDDLVKYSYKALDDIIANLPTNEKFLIDIPYSHVADIRRNLVSWGYNVAGHFECYSTVGGVECVRVYVSLTSP